MTSIIKAAPQNDNAAISITQGSLPSVALATNYTVNLFNWGTHPQSNYLVKLYTEGDLEIACSGTHYSTGNCRCFHPVLATHHCRYDLHLGKVILMGDENSGSDQTTSLNVSVQPAGIIGITIGAGDETNNIPVRMYSHNSLYETIFLADELNFHGTITSLCFYNTFETNVLAMPTKIWLGTTDQTGINSGWIPSTQLSLVFDGNMDYPSGQNTITFALTQPFEFMEGNLVMMVYRPLDATTYDGTNAFYGQYVSGNHSCSAASDSYTYNPAAPPTGSYRYSYFPKTSLFYNPSGVGHLTGTIYGEGNLPLPCATICILNGQLTTADATGHNRIYNVPAGNRTITASLDGYYDSSLDVTLTEGSTVTQDFTLTPLPATLEAPVLTLTEEPAGTLHLSWTAISGAHSYVVYATDSLVSGTWTPAPFVETTTLELALPGDTRFYRVVASSAAPTARIAPLPVIGSGASNTVRSISDKHEGK